MYLVTEHQVEPWGQEEGARSTIPLSASTSMIWPLVTTDVASLVDMTAGIPYSRATNAAFQAVLSTPLRLHQLKTLTFWSDARYFQLEKTHP